MTMFGNLQGYNFGAPNYNQGTDPEALNDALQYRQSQQNQQMQFQKDLMNMQNTQRMREIAAARPPDRNPVMAGDRYNPYNSVAGGGNVVFKDDDINEYQKAQLGLAGRRLDITEQANQQKNAIAQQRADTYAQLAENPNYTRIVSKGGTVSFMDKKSGAVIDTGVPAGTMTDEAKLTQQGQQAQALEGTRQKGRTELEAEKEKNREALTGVQGGETRKNIEAKGVQSRLTKGTLSANAGVNAQLPTQQAKAIQNRANQFINAHPELQGLVTIDADGRPQIAAPSSGGIFGGTSFSPADRERAMDFIFGGLGAQAPQSNVNASVGPVNPAYTAPQFTSGGAPINAPVAAPAAPSGGTISTGRLPHTVRVRTPDGKVTGTWDMSKGPVPRGYVVIQ